MRRARTFVVHWNPDELPDKIRIVEGTGAEVVGAEATDGAQACRQIEQLVPDAVILWLKERPNHGRLMAAAIQSQNWGAKIPILFMEGDAFTIGAKQLAEVKSAVPGGLFVTPQNLAMWLDKIVALHAAQELQTARELPAD